MTFYRGTQREIISENKGLECSFLLSRISPMAFQRDPDLCELTVFDLFGCGS